MKRIFRAGVALAGLLVANASSAATEFDYAGALLAIFDDGTVDTSFVNCRCHLNGGRPAQFDETFEQPARNSPSARRRAPHNRVIFSQILIARTQ